MSIYRVILTFTIISMVIGCSRIKQKADVIFINGNIFTVNSTSSLARAMAIKDGKIMAVGSEKQILEAYTSTDLLDLGGRPVYPGLIDAHCHFYGYALGLQYIDLSNTDSFDEVIQRIQAVPNPSGAWMVGRGWDQNRWKDKRFPDNRRLNLLYPTTPVMLIRVDGHVVLANQAALDAAKIDKIHSFGPGQVDIKNGILTGILSELAADKIRGSLPVPQGDILVKLLKEAEQRCFAVGLTTVSDAGLDYDQVMTLDSLHQSENLSMHVYAMLTPNEMNLKNLVDKGLFQTKDMVARSIKIYADGSLGSRTAKLKESYSDAPAQTGIIVTQPDSILALCKLALGKGFQVNTHCIGDSATRLVLGIYAEFLKGKNDLRWRIEHAQVVDQADLHLFGDYSIIPSVQATHATSDMYWAEDRLGPTRIKGAYAYKNLLDQNGWLPNGTDFPIENISPLMTFYAAVSRQDIKGFPNGGFQIENALSREEAIRSITIWAAKANFMEKTKGSLEVGKDADFIVLDQDIMSIPVNLIPDVNVIQSFIRGKSVYKR